MDMTSLSGNMYTAAKCVSEVKHKRQDLSFSPTLKNISVKFKLDQFLTKLGVNFFFWKK